jgi:tryptophanyl-tRNA synthetase
MSKSRGNTVPLSATADETAAIIRRAVTDSGRVITYEPVARPGVAALLEIGAAIGGDDPDSLAARIGSAGSAGLKQEVTTRINDLLAPVRTRRAELAADPGALRELLVRGTVTARETAGRVLDRVHRSMGLQHF